MFRGSRTQAIRRDLVLCCFSGIALHTVDDLVLDPSAVAAVRLRAVSPDGPDADRRLAGAVVLEARCRVRPPQSAALYPALTGTAAAFAHRDEADDARAGAALVPYYLWGNREPGPMRVWIRSL